MIKRLHSLAPAIILIGPAVLVALTVAAQVVKAPEYPTTGEMHRFVFLLLLSGAGTVLMIVAGAYVWDQRRRDKQIDTVQKENARQITELSGIVRGHHDNWAMHPAGSTHRIDVFEKKLDDLGIAMNAIQAATLALVEGEKRTAKDLEDVEVRLRATEGTLQTLHAEHTMLRGTLPTRDPMDSPNKRRETDSQTGGDNGSGDDHRMQRVKRKWARP